MSYSGAPTTKKWAVQTYGIAQIAKYLPGNVFQFAGRQAIGQAAGLPAIPLARSAFLEILLLAGTGSFFTILVLPLLWPRMTVSVSLLLFISALVTIAFVIFRWFSLRLASALRWEILFLVLSGLVFNGVIQTVHVKPLVDSNFVVMTAVYVVAWLAGLVTPGAPAGIGVREMVFLALLHGVVKEHELLVAILLGRLVTISGDVLFYIFSTALHLYRKKSRGKLISFEHDCNDITDI